MEPATELQRRSGMKASGVALPLFALVLVLCGCSSASGATDESGLPSVASSSSPVATEVAVTGHLLRMGGPVGTPTKGVPGTVTFSGAAGSVSVTVPDDGRFTVNVAPGVYTPVGSSPVLGGGACYSSPDTSVDIQVSTTVNIVCNIR
jgi:hypothetical protein